MKKKCLIATILVFLCLVAATVLFIIFGSKNFKGKDVQETKHLGDSSFSTSFFINTNKVATDNFLVSPYSVKVALSMLRDGANNNTKTEIDKVIGSDKIPLLNNDSVHIANALFIRDTYKDGINPSYKQGLIDNYKSDVLYDEFKTPDVINNWVKKETSDMIEKVVEEMNDDFVLGLANAIAIDVKWKHPFDCISTSSNEFTRKDGTKFNVEMMHQTYSTSDVSYIASEDAKGIIIPYEDETNLEFIAILPNDNIDDYIKELTLEKIYLMEEKKESGSEDVNIRLSLPRFKYDFDLKEFMQVLSNMGIKDVFDPQKSDLTTMMTKDKMKELNIDSLYVAEAVHKTHIDLNEKGTKAAAVTYFGVYKNTSVAEPRQPKIINVELNKSFIYMIRDKESKEILFIGVVDKPNEWKSSTCDNL
ncbi:MAG: hypothetical protein K5666_02815 [Bacilli bacterium]|nr:hypothetical protein [Bacilli bacterium]